MINFKGDFFEFLLVHLKRNFSGTHKVEDNTKWPNINPFIKRFDDLWSHVFKGSNWALELLGCDLGCAAEITYFDSLFIIDQNILRLNIPMSYFLFMKSGNSLSQLQAQSLNLATTQNSTLTFPHKTMKIPLPIIFHNKVITPLILKPLLQSDNKLCLQALLNFDLMLGFFLPLTIMFPFLIFGMVEIPLNITFWNRL